ncbi:thioredoxin family protein [Candidatus Kaiserbacteria bacterium]|nr:thioredoxin family protein [Candidatus Kaiserbacteria bacterium]
MTNNTLQKGSASPALIGVIALLVAVGGIGYFAVSRQSSSMMEPTADHVAPMIDGQSMTGEAMMKGDEMKAEDDAMMKKDDAMMMQKYTGTVLAGTSAPLLEYNKADYDAAVRSGKLVVLYFYANWCPICKAEFPKAQAAFDQIDSDMVVGFRVSFKDNETDKDEEALARQFGVPYQHTKVFVKDGKQILKAPNEWDTARYLTEIDKALGQ